MANRFGHSLSITSFGESHGPLTGVVLDGLPGGIPVDETAIHTELQRRRPGQSAITTSRIEKEAFSIVSGVFEGLTTGTPICITIPNTNQNPADYESLKHVFRPGHADMTYALKYGHRDHRGGGRSSARITAAWVAAGAIVKTYLLSVHQITVEAVVSRIGGIALDNVFDIEWNTSSENPVRCPNPAKAAMMETLILNTAAEGDSLGGVISARIKGCPAGLGEPVFDKLNADLAKAMFSINAVKGLEFGSGFAGSAMKGSENNDTADSNRNNDGGISGGISNGKDICFKVAFKPVSSIASEQMAYNDTGETIPLKIEGRHDPCVLPRAVPIVEAMAAICIADHLLLNLKYKK